MYRHGAELAESDMAFGSQHQVHTSGQRIIAVFIQQALPRHVNGSQRRGAGCVEA